MKELLLTAGSGKSRLVVGANIDPAQYCGGVAPLVVTDTALAEIYRERLAPYDVIAIPPGEEKKSLATVERLYERFCEHKLERRSLVLSFGGGVLSDLTGFAAATYLRGVRFGAVATTLLAQVDASIGGKNGVNFGGFKNLVGTIRQAEFCLCDTALLATLPKRDLHCGFSEVIKHAAINQAELFSYLETNCDAVLALQPNQIEHVVYESIVVKAKIVEADETEQGERRKLNFGHTLGHAIEAKYHIPHGEAVSIGMILAARISLARGLFSQKDFERLHKLIERFHLPTQYKFEIGALMEWIERDKKRSGDGIFMVLLEGIGRSRVEKITFSELRKALQ